jgi:hypothetical protein
MDTNEYKLSSRRVVLKEIVHRFVLIDVHSWLEAEPASDPAHLGLRKRFALFHGLLH